MVHVGSADDNRKLVSAVPGIDWAVLGHSGMNLELPEKAGSARMLEAMMKGRNLGRLDLHVVGDSLAFTDRGERAEIETILADHRSQLTEYDRRLGETDPAAMRDYYDAAAQGDRSGDRTRDGAAAVAARGNRRELVREPHHPAGRGDAGTARRRDPGRRVQQGEREARGAGKPVGLGTESPRPKPAPGAAAPPAGRHVHRHRDMRRMPRAGPRVLEDDQARARPVRPGARRPRQGPVVRRLPRDRLPATGRPRERR